jgi:hypothetical protein
MCRTYGARIILQPTHTSGFACARHSVRKHLAISHWQLALYFSSRNGFQATRNGSGAGPRASREEFARTKLSCALRLGTARGWNRHSGIGHQYSSRQRSRKNHSEKADGTSALEFLRWKKYLGRTPCIGMARDTLSGPFDFAPVTDYRNTFWRRSAQGDR